jgi:hypothetical protein
MSGKCSVFTSCNLAYLDRALVLAESVKKNNPNVDFILILSDYVDEILFSSAAMSCFDQVIDIEDIGITNFKDWSGQFNVVELCTAVKGYAFLHIFSMGYKKVLYLDPDIACFSPLDFLFRELLQYSILLTPHQLTPAKTKQEFIDNELCSYKHGIFNLGFLGLNNSSEAGNFLQWWSNRLYLYCREDTANGIFTDQKWCDAVPAFFDDYKIIRHPGCNVASWNLCERQISFRDGSLVVDEHFPLVFYHFTKYFGPGIEMTMRYASSVEGIAVWNWYGRRIKDARTKYSEPPRQGKYKS